MALKLGTTTASLYLGSTPVAAYLGATQVYSTVQAVTLYFFYDPEAEGADGDWTTVGNWWLDDEHTQAAGRLPTSADSVVATANILSNSGSPPTVNAFEIDGNDIEIDIAFTVLTIAVWKTNSVGGANMILTGNAEWNGTNGNAGVVNGNATFNDTTFNAGTINGNATFNGSGSIGGGTVTGTTTNNR
jgi:hypothetical protein